MSLQDLIQQKKTGIYPTKIEPKFNQPANVGLAGLIQQKKGVITTATPKKNLLYKGLDILNTGSFAIGGLLSGKGIVAGIKEKINPSDVLNVKNPVARFIVDVALDPTTYLTFGAGAGAKIGAKGVGLVGGKVAGKALSKKGASELARIVERKVAEKGLKEVDKTIADVIVNEARIELAKKIDKGAVYLLERSAVKASVPFTNTEFKLANLPKTPAFVQRAGEAFSKTGLGQGVQKVGKSLDEIFSNTAKIRQEKKLARREELFQIQNAERAGKPMITQGVVEKITPVLKKTDEEAFDTARKYIEKNPNGSTFNIIKSTLKMLDDDVGKNLTKAQADKAKIVVKEAYPSIKKLEAELVNAGLIKPTKEVAYFPRKKDLEGVVRPSITGTSGIKDMTRKARTMKTIVKDGEATGVAKLTERGKRITTPEGRARYVSAEEVQARKAKITKEREAGLKMKEKELQRINIAKQGIKADEAKRASNLAKTKEELKGLRRITPSQYVAKAKADGFKPFKTSVDKIKPTRTTPNSDVVKANLEKLNKGEKLEPIIISKSGTIVDGNHRFEAMKQFGMKEIPVLSREKQIGMKVAEVQKKQILKTVPKRRIGKTTAELSQREKILQTQKERIRAKTAEGLKKIENKYGKGDIFIDRKGNKYKLREATVEEIENFTKIKFERALPSMLEGLIKNENAIRVHKMIKGIVEKADQNISGLGVRKIVGKVDNGFVDLQDLTKMPVAKGYQIPESLVPHFKGYFEFASDEAPTKLFGEAYDSVQNWWKSQALLGAAYHSRNVVSNMFNSWLGGLKNPATTLKGMNTFFKQTKIGKHLGTLSKQEKEHLTAFYKTGAGSGDFFTSEVLDEVIERVKGRSWNPLSRRSKLVGASQDIGQFLENSQKFALFMDRVNKGDNYTAAAQYVKKFMFDYTDLTKTEQQIFKKIVPFYSWIRKNLPLQVENLIKQPGKAATTLKAERIIQPENAEEVKANLPDYLDGGHAVVLPWKDSKGNQLVINAEGILPLYDLSNIYDFKFKNFVDMISPIIKTPAELASNADFFNNFKKINETKEPMQSLFVDLIDPPFVGGQPRSKFWGGIFNDAQTKVLTTASRPLRDLDNFFAIGLTESEQKDYRLKISKILFATVTPVDVIEQQSWKSYLDSQAKSEYLDYYKKVNKRFIKNENNIDLANMQRAEKRMIELGIPEEDILASQTDALREVIKYDKLGVIINKAIKEGRKPTPAETADIKRELAKTYAGTGTEQRRKAKQAIDKLIEQKINGF